MSEANAPSIRGWIAVAAAIVVAGALGLAGSLVPAEQAPAARAAAHISGRTNAVCTTGTLTQGDRTSDPGTRVIGVAAKSDPNSDGTLSARELGDQGNGEPPMSITTQGQGRIVSGPDRSMVMTADGVMAGSSAGMVYASSEDGENRGLSLAPCVTPAVDQWFTGLGAGDELRSQLVITNPDDRQAEVDLEFYDENGLMSVPGGSGLIIPAGQSRTASLEELLPEAKGEVTVNVRATVGRVSVIGRTLRSGANSTPTGADWQTATTAPATSQIIPAIPGGPGERQLVVSNPGDRRAEVKIEVMGPDGPFAPVDANEATVEAGSATTLDISEGLAQRIGSVRITSDQPVLSAVRSERPGSAKPNDIAIQTAQAPVNQVGIVPAAVVSGAETEVALSNGGTAPVNADFSVINMDGVSLYHEEIPVAPGASIERRVAQAGPAYVVVRTPAGSQVYGGITLRQMEGDVYGLASAALVTPALAGQGRPSENDPRVGQSAGRS